MNFRIYFEQKAGTSRACQLAMNTRNVSREDVWKSIPVEIQDDMAFLSFKESRRRLAASEKHAQIFDNQRKMREVRIGDNHLRRRGGDLRMMADVVRPAGHQVVLLLEVLHDGVHVSVLASLHRELRHLQQIYHRQNRLHKIEILKYLQ